MSTVLLLTRGIKHQILERTNSARIFIGDKATPPPRASWVHVSPKRKAQKDPLKESWICPDTYTTPLKQRP